MTDKPMTWAELGAWIATLTPEQLAMRAIVFDNEAGVFTTASTPFLAAKEDVGQFIYSELPSEVAEGQPILQIY